eukprot:21046_1
MADESIKKSILSQEPRVPGYIGHGDIQTDLSAKRNDSYIPNQSIEINNGNNDLWLGFNDIRLAIMDSKTNQPKNILDGICGQSFGGELYGIIGASGGGKTTLLSVLSGRIGRLESLNTKCTVTGEVQLNNTLMNCNKINNFEYLRNSIAFVLQEDILLPTELAREAIEVSAKLRLPNAMSNEYKLQKVEQILHALDLINCSETKIGGKAIRGLSGGERKRVSIGIELVTDPNILMLDEPTSGLDSAIAYQTMVLLRKLANEGKMVIASIHQPSSEIFSTLDRVLILAQGKAIYEGKVNKLAEYFASIGYECPRYSNIADFVLQKCCENTQFFINKWDEYIKTDSNSSYFIVKRRMKEKEDVINLYKTEMAPLCTQLNVLMKRQFVIFIRDKVPTFVRFGQAIFTAVLQGALWWQLKDMNKIAGNSIEMSENTGNRFGGIFYATSFAAMNAIMVANLTFPSQRLVFQKERVANWYYSIFWIFSKSCIDLPVTFFVILPFSVIIKYMVNFQAQFYEIFFILSLVALVGDSMGFCLGCVAKRPDIAAQLTPVTIIPLFLFSNFFVSNKSIPIWIRWIQYIDCFYYGTEALCIWEFKDKQSIDHIDSGNQILAQYDMHTDNLWRDIYALIILFVGIRLIAIAILLRKNGI